MNDPIGQRSRRVPPRTRRRRRVRGWMRRALLTAAFLLAGLATGALLAAAFGSYLALPPDPPPLAWERPAPEDYDSLASVPQTAPQTRPVYPFSVIPGGVRDRWDLERSFDDDPAVAQHYLGFNFHRARLIRLAEDQAAYVSYRIGPHVFWTAHKVVLHRGEKLLTDGHITARTRCGNQVSALPHPVVSPMEPSQAELEQPLPPLVPAIAQFSAPPGVPRLVPAPGAPPTATHGAWFPPLIPLYPFGGGTPGPAAHPRAPAPQGPPLPPPGPPVPVSMPEPAELGPAALFLFCVGVAGLFRRYCGRLGK